MTTDTVAILTAVGTAIRDELRRQGVLDETSIDPTRVALKSGASADLLELAEAAVGAMVGQIREPTKVMMEDGREAMWEGLTLDRTSSETVVTDVDPRLVWSAMLERVLK